MFNFDLNEPYIDLNSAPDLESPILVPQNADMSAGELNGVQPADENILLEISQETLVSCMPAGETSRPQKQKGGQKRVSPESVYTGKRPEGLPDGWVIKERVRLSGRLAGNKYKYFIDPGTLKSFRSLKSVLHHLGLPDSKPSKNKHRKSPARGGVTLYNIRRANRKSCQVSEKIEL